MSGKATHPHSRIAHRQERPLHARAHLATRSDEPAHRREHRRARAQPLRRLTSRPLPRLIDILRPTQPTAARPRTRTRPRPTGRVRRSRRGFACTLRGRRRRRLSVLLRVVRLIQARPVKVRGCRPARYTPARRRRRYRRGRDARLPHDVRFLPRRPERGHALARGVPRARAPRGAPDRTEGDLARGDEVGDPAVDVTPGCMRVPGVRRRHWGWGCEERGGGRQLLPAVLVSFGLRRVFLTAYMRAGSCWRECGEEGQRGRALLVFRSRCRSSGRVSVVAPAGKASHARWRLRRHHVQIRCEAYRRRRVRAFFFPAGCRRASPSAPSRTAARCHWRVLQRRDRGARPC